MDSSLFIAPLNRSPGWVLCLDPAAAFEEQAAPFFFTINDSSDRHVYEFMRD